MSAIDPSRSWAAIDERLAHTTDPRHRRMLETVKEHVRAETMGEFDALMATMCGTPAFHFWVEGNGHGAGPKGLDAVREHYRRLYAEQRHLFELDVERLVVDDHTVVTEGWFRQLYRGSVLVERGVPDVDPDAVYLVTTRLLLLWPFDDAGELIGEDSYSGGRMFAPDSITRVDPADVPEELRPAHQ